jgi:hypothetical protein
MANSSLAHSNDMPFPLETLIATPLIGLTIGHRLHAKLSREQVGGFISVLLIASRMLLLWKAL